MKVIWLWNINMDSGQTQEAFFQGKCQGPENSSTNRCEWLGASGLILQFYNLNATTHLANDFLDEISPGSETSRDCPTTDESNEILSLFTPTLALETPSIDLSGWIIVIFLVSVGSPVHFLPDAEQ